MTCRFDVAQGWGPAATGKTVVGEAVSAGNVVDVTDDVVGLGALEWPEQPVPMPAAAMSATIDRADLVITIGS